MTWDNSKYIKLLLERREGRSDKWLIALRTTADYYGWTEKFPTWTLRPAPGQGPEGRFAMHPGRGEMFCERGVKCRVCRSVSRNANPPGKTNQFKVSRTCGVFDMAEIAYFTQSDWHWMSGPDCRRRTRDEWLAIYDAQTHKRRGGLVSV